MFINAVSPVEGFFSPVMAGWFGAALVVINLLVFGRSMIAVILMKLHGFFIQHGPIRL